MDKLSWRLAEVFTNLSKINFIYLLSEQNDIYYVFSKLPQILFKAFANAEIIYEIHRISGFED